MARGKISRFISYPTAKQGGGLSDTEARNLVDIAVKSSIRDKTAYGTINTMEEAQAVIESVRNAPALNDAAALYKEEKLIDLQNEGLQLSAKYLDINTDKQVFDSSLREQLKGIAQTAHADIMGSLIPNYAIVYQQAADDYRELLNSKIERYGSVGDVTQEVTDYADQLEERATFYNSLANSYIWPDEETGELGAGLDPKEVAVLVETNPGTGRITNVEIVPSSQVPNDYLATNVNTKVSSTQKARNLPMYLRASTANKDGKPVNYARLGELTFQADGDSQGDNTTKLLKVKDETGFWKDLFTRTDADKAESAGVDLGNPNLQFNGNDIPESSLVRVGNRLFAQPKAGELYEIGGKTAQEQEKNLQRFLSASGVPIEDVKTYYAGRQFLFDGQGSSKVRATVDENFFKVGTGQVPGSTPASTALQPERNPQTTSPGGQTQAVGPGFASFFSAKNRTPGVDEAPARTGNDVIDKGQQFFKAGARTVLSSLNPVLGAGARAVKGFFNE